MGYYYLYSYFDRTNKLHVTRNGRAFSLLIETVCVRWGKPGVATRRSARRAICRIFPESPIHPPPPPRDGHRGCANTVENRHISRGRAYRRRAPTTRTEGERRRGRRTKKNVYENRVVYCLRPDYSLIVR